MDSTNQTGLSYGYQMAADTSTDATAAPQYATEQQQQPVGDTIAVGDIGELAQILGGMTDEQLQNVQLDPSLLALLNQTFGSDAALLNAAQAQADSTLALTQPDSSLGLTGTPADSSTMSYETSLIQNTDLTSTTQTAAEVTPGTGDIFKSLAESVTGGNLVISDTVNAGLTANMPDSTSSVVNAVTASDKDIDAVSSPVSTESDHSVASVLPRMQESYTQKPLTATDANKASTNMLSSILGSDTTSSLQQNILSTDTTGDASAEAIAAAAFLTPELQASLSLGELSELALQQLGTAQLGTSQLGTSQVSGDSGQFDIDFSRTPTVSSTPAAQPKIKPSPSKLTQYSSLFPQKAQQRTVPKAIPKTYSPKLSGKILPSLSSNFVVKTQASTTKSYGGLSTMRAGSSIGSVTSKSSSTLKFPSSTSRLTDLSSQPTQMIPQGDGATLVVGSGANSKQIVLSKDQLSQLLNIQPGQKVVYVMKPKGDGSKPSTVEQKIVTPSNVKQNGSSVATGLGSMVNRGSATAPKSMKVNAVLSKPTKQIHVPANRGTGSGKYYSFGASRVTLPATSVTVTVSKTSMTNTFTPNIKTIPGPSMKMSSSAFNKSPKQVIVSSPGTAIGGTVVGGISTGSVGGINAGTVGGMSTQYQTVSLQSLIDSGVITTSLEIKKLNTPMFASSSTTSVSESDIYSQASKANSLLNVVSPNLITSGQIFNDSQVSSLVPDEEPDIGMQIDDSEPLPEQPENIMADPESSDSDSHGRKEDSLLTPTTTDQSVDTLVTDSLSLGAAAGTDPLSVAAAGVFAPVASESEILPAAEQTDTTVSSTSVSTDEVQAGPSSSSESIAVSSTADSSTNTTSSISASSTTQSSSVSANSILSPAHQQVLKNLGLSTETATVLTTPRPSFIKANSTVNLIQVKADTPTKEKAGGKKGGTRRTFVRNVYVAKPSGEFEVIELTDDDKKQLAEYCASIAKSNGEQGAEPPSFLANAANRTASKSGTQRKKKGKPKKSQAKEPTEVNEGIEDLDGTISDSDDGDSQPSSSTNQGSRKRARPKKFDEFVMTSAKDGRADADDPKSFSLDELITNRKRTKIGNINSDTSPPKSKKSKKDPVTDKGGKAKKRRKKKKSYFIGETLPEHLKPKSKPAASDTALIDLSKVRLKSAFAEKSFTLPETVSEGTCTSLQRKSWLCTLCGKPSNIGNLDALFGPYQVKLTDKQENKDKNVSQKKKKKTSSSSCNMTVWLHRDCAIWTPNICLTGQTLHGLCETLESSVNTKCALCSQIGATLQCMDRKCRDDYHYVCARQRGCTFDENTFTITCPKHK